MTKKDIKETIQNSRHTLTELGVSKIGLFGSFAREEQTPDSDIDVYIEFDPEKETFDNYMELCFLLEELFEDKEVDVVTQHGLSPYIGPHILKEVEYVQIDD